ncbi:thioredoxin-like protein [Abortiporus biennis]|nr:thioredoxin-like protein [Abortiporus biennis]
MPHPLVGKQAPELTLPDANGQPFTLKPGSGTPIALFFYPKAGTYGCTKEACSFRDNIAEKGVYSTTNVQVVGVSGDPVQKQKQFVESQKLTYPILSDEKGEARKAYSIGKALFGLTDARTTFIIDSKGVVRDSLDATLNYSSHSRFVDNWLGKLAAEDKAVTEAPSPSTTVTAATPAPAPVVASTEEQLVKEAGIEAATD